MLDFCKIEKFATELDTHLKKLESFTSVLKEVKISLDTFVKSQNKNQESDLISLKNEISNISDILKQYGLPLNSKYENKLNDIKAIISSDDFPIAVPEENLCMTEENKFARADSILNLFVAEDLNNKRFLDFGCGEGHVVIESLKKETLFSLGYDIDLSQCKFENKNFTSNFDDVVKNGPYDIILVHDVLDHIISKDPITVLQDLHNILNVDGLIYVRNHPWSSRHGGHLYNKLNKSFIHLILDEIELTRCYGIQPEHTLKITTPIETYNQWFNESNLEIKSQLIIKSNVETMLLDNPVIKEKIINQFENKDNCIQNLEIDFIEYVLKKRINILL